MKKHPDFVIRFWDWWDRFWHTQIPYEEQKKREAFFAEWKWAIFAGIYFGPGLVLAILLAMWRVMH
jgi:hypothetical protein